MSLAELLRTAVASICAHKLRASLTILGIVIAVWTIVSVIAVIWGMNDYVRTQIFNLSPDVIVVTRFGIITSFEDFVQASKRKEITPHEVDRLRELCRSCADIGMTLNGSRAVHAGNRRLSSVPLIGTTSTVGALLNIDLEAGRYLTEFEDEHRRPVAIIGSEVREQLFPHLDPIGRTIWIGQVPHQVIGVKAKQGSVLGQSQDLVVYTPYRTAAKQLGYSQGRRFDVQVNVLVKARGGVEGVADCQQEVVQIFRWLRHTPFRDADPVGLVSAEMVQDLWRQISLTTFIVVTAIASVSLLVGAIVVANIMIVSVVERTNEIGLRMALGARKRDIRRQFLVEALVLVLAGGALGAAAGTTTAWVIQQKAPVPATASPGLVVVALAIALAAGLLAGVFPARKAANLPPIEALQRD